jgi:hypothetical protein
LEQKRREAKRRCGSRRSKRRDDHRRALELLAGCGAEGCSEAIMRGHGFTTEMLAELLRGALRS